MSRALGRTPPVFGHAGSPPAPLDPASSTPGEMPCPPAELTRLHSPEVFEEAWARLHWHVRHPVAVLESGPQRRVRVLGDYWFEFREDCTIDITTWKYEPQGWRIRGLSSHAVSVGGVPLPWLEHFRRGFLIDVRRRRDRERGATPEQLMAYSEWVFVWFRERLDAAELQRMATAIQDGTGLDPAVIALASRLRCRLGDGAAATLTEYEVALHHRRELEKVVKEGPHLLRLYALLAQLDRFPREGEPLQRLRIHVEAVASPGVWRMLANAPGDPLHQFFRLYWGWAPHAAEDFLRLLHGLRCRRLPPAWLLWDLLQILYPPRRESWISAIENEWLVYRHVVALAERASPAQLASMRRSFYAVLHWIFETRFFLPDKMQRRAGWEYLHRRAVRWHTEQRERVRLAGVAWAAPIPAFEMAGFRVTPLGFALALCDEARAMSHCADRYVADCRDGLVAIFSVTRIADGKRVATMGFRRRPGAAWGLLHACGHANRPLDQRLEPLQREVQARLAKATFTPGWLRRLVGQRVPVQATS